MDKYIAQGDGFPGDNEFLMLIQSIIGEVSQLSALGGSNYVLKGCEVNGNDVADGWVVINDEILRFEGGANVLNTHVHIVEDIENATYLEDLDNDNQGDSKPTYFYRKAVFGGANGAVISWANLNKSFSALVDVPKALTPVGAIVMWSGAINAIPNGWSLCDGSNGTPDLRGKFIVGYHSGDADYNAIGDQGGAKQVTLTESQMPSHNHSGNTNSSGSHKHDVGNRNTSTPEHTDTTQTEWGGHTVNINQQVPTSYAGLHSHSFNTNNKGGSQPHENRPPYFTLAYIMFKG